MKANQGPLASSKYYDASVLVKDLSHIREKFDLVHLKVSQKAEG